jgi:ubiquinone/menaquinone biosynthesis C-methylase UbiE
MEKKQDMIRCYDSIYSTESNFKEAWDGRIAVIYKVPKYLKIFFRRFRGKPAMDVLELGAGNGEVSELIRKQGPSFIKSYVATEISKEGVKKLREKGFKAFEVDAQDLSRFQDNSFDLVFCIDTMHHVSDPRKMAQEMLRVSRKHVFLIEANGACILRKILERTKKYRMAGEGSYSPKKYISFFRRGPYGHAIMAISIRPFLFMVPFTPPVLFRPMIFMSELLEKIPIVKWQGSGVVIFAEKNQES